MALDRIGAILDFPPLAFGQAVDRCRFTLQRPDPEIACFEGLPNGLRLQSPSPFGTVLSNRPNRDSTFGRHRILSLSPHSDRFPNAMKARSVFCYEEGVKGFRVSFAGGARPGPSEQVPADLPLMRPSLGRNPFVAELDRLYARVAEHKKKVVFVGAAKVPGARNRRRVDCDADHLHPGFGKLPFEEHPEVVQLILVDGDDENTVRL